MLLLLLLHLLHLHELLLLLHALLRRVEIVHSLKCCVFDSAWVGMSGGAHHAEQVIDLVLLRRHILLLRHWLLLLLHRVLWHGSVDTLEGREAVVLRQLLGRRSTYEISELVVVFGGSWRKANQIWLVLNLRRRCFPRWCWCRSHSCRSSSESTLASFLGFFLLSDRLFIAVVVSTTTLVGDALEEFVKAGALVDEEVQGVIFHGGVHPALLHVLLLQEASHFARVRVLRRLLIVRWQVCLPVSIDKVVAERLEDLDLALRPLVQIHRLDLGDVHTESAVLAGAPEADECAESDRGPSGGLAGAVSARVVRRLLQQGFELANLRLQSLV
mmetsp:Transcript_9896/g.13483  ORF Transcript_9896/g.13483 Transcript_9896/m.13483 type:complete len:329 (-) Transcript_9896:79-1065(-)